MDYFFCKIQKTLFLRCFWALPSKWDFFPKIRLCQLFTLQGAMKLYFTHYSCVVIILFNTGLYKSVFSIDSFGRLAFCLSALFAFVCGIRRDPHKLHNICIIIVYIVGIRYSLFLFSLISKKKYRVIKFEYRQLLINNMPPQGAFEPLKIRFKFKVLKIPLIKKNVKHTQNERVK